MGELIIGLVAIAIGLYLCLRGQWALRLLLAVWGAFAGFHLGAAVVSGLTGDGFLATALGWIVSVVLAIVFAGIAYIYYSIAIVIALASMGFVLGATIASAIGASGNWLPAILGVGLGIVFAVFAIAADMPRIILIVISASAGASITVSGLLVVFGVLELDDIIEGRAAAQDYPWWYGLIVVLTIIGIVVQANKSAQLDAGLRETWAANSKG